MWKKSLPALVILLITGWPVAAQTARWTEKEAADWYAKQAWLVGSNYIPADAINELEMWQADTFDPSRIDAELELASSIGMNTARVFLHDLLWEEDPARASYITAAAQRRRLIRAMRLRSPRNVAGPRV